MGTHLQEQVNFFNSGKRKLILNCEETVEMGDSRLAKCLPSFDYERIYSDYMILYNRLQDGKISPEPEFIVEILKEFHKLPYHSQMVEISQLHVFLDNKDRKRDIVRRILSEPDAGERLERLILRFRSPKSVS